MRVSVMLSRKEAVVATAEATFRLSLFENESTNFNARLVDFAVWLCLPVAMRLGEDLHVEGIGSRETCHNAGELSRTWESWLPGRFSAVQVSFDHYSSATPDQESNKNVCLYSGGLDSTYTALKLKQSRLDPYLLTVFGMDYKLGDSDRFRKLIEKTSNFADRNFPARVFLESNAYEVYRKYRINIDGGHFTHIFALMAAAFALSESFDSVFIAADGRLDQQFIMHPWGSNSATNPWFSDGHMQLKTHGDDALRADKVAALAGNSEAMSAVTVCMDYDSRPHNCGVCSK